MDLYFAGAEQPKYLKLLDDLGAQHIAVSFYEWQRRHHSDDLYKHIPDHMKICVTAGVARKDDLEWVSFGQDYVEFCERNADRCLIYDMDAHACPLDVRILVRDHLSMFPNLVAFPIADEELAIMATSFERLGINANLGKSIPANELRRLPASLYGSNITDSQRLRGGRFTATTSFAWLSARKYGELWVFARNKLHHYAAENLAKAVRAHGHDIEAFDVDPQACAANDSEALTAVAVRSLQAMAESLSRRPRDRSRAVVTRTSAPEGTAEVMADEARSLVAMVQGNGALPITPRERRLLPVVAMKVDEEQPKVASVSAQQRSCDTCYLSTVCPEYQPESSCAFDLPVEIKTEEQRRAATQTLLEMQFQRISFGMFAEQIEGQGLTPRVGQEIDRFHKMLSVDKELETPIHVPGNGAMSQAFANVIPPVLEEGVHRGFQEEDDDIEEGEVVDDFTDNKEVSSPTGQA